MIDTKHLIYYSDNLIKYDSVNDVVYYLERTLTEIVQKTRLTRFVIPSACYITKSMGVGVFQLELDLKDSVVGVEFYESKDLERLQNNFLFLQKDTIKKWRNGQINMKRIEKNYQIDCQKYISIVQNGQLTMNIEQQALNITDNRNSAWLTYCDFVKNNQFYIFFEIKFLSLKRSASDRSARTSNLVFQVQRKLC